MQGEFIVHENTTPLPTIHVVSDSVGLTAQALARAAAAQFGVTNPNIEVLPHVRSFEEVKQFMHEEALKLDELADPALATLNVDVDIYYSNTDVRLTLNTTRLETDAEFTERVEQAKAAKAAEEAAAKLRRRERRQQIKRKELQLLAKLKAKYER